ncbi:MAG: DUF389 domain-containing protein [Chloroflexi bacterium]|nr:DUF389 domain-containing protein [Chloroflexota bacterium]
MLHVRLVSPAELTERLLHALASAAGVQNVSCQRAGARRPDGDAVQFDVRRGAANAVFGLLRELQIDRHGAVTVESVDAPLAAPARRRDASTYFREVAPVWELVEARIRGDAVYPPSFFILLVIAGLIGAVGILSNSTILIVGAMVVGPEYSAIIAVALGITDRDRDVAVTGAAALIAGFALTIAVTFVFALAVRMSGQTPALFDAGVRPVSDFINQPDVFSVIVAVLAGVVGVVSLTEARASALIGVFISVTTIPAAADIAVSSSFGAVNEAAGSLMQLLLNVALLIVVGAAGLAAQRQIWHRRVGS